ncbi:MAG TPA: YicC/YloC family endoribonuclease [Acidobacteriota bacterium]|jgi:uncharacterized protein (TIGR00255 family)|nr:YicC/YloC family endoribonuclease [Acidobacteriota bacterium]
MNLASMTGFGQGDISGADFQISFEIKTFNSRFLDINVRLPKELLHMEMFVRNVVKEKVARGRVEVFINLQTTEGGFYQINRDVVASYQELAKTLNRDFQIGGSLTFAILLQLPGVIETRSPSFPQAEVFEEQARKGLLAALDAVKRMRLEEGRQLAAELLNRISQAEELLQQIESLIEPAKQAYRERLWQRLQEHTDAGKLDVDRITQEVVIFAERGDITEEILRLRSHIEQFRSLIRDGCEVGKTLDFLLQEMNRETNTILSKNLHHKISELGVLLKAEVEKLREQVQNVE